jgi:hypothetical protein
MRSWKTPTPDQVAKAVALLGRREQYRYFFERLQNPLWLEPLAQRGFFQNPPPAIGNEKTGSVRFPPWPESQYLARMARLPEAHGQVLEIALRIETDNVGVHEDVADVALALPAQMAARLVPKAKKWAESRYQLFLLPGKLGALVEHLARGGAVDEALDLAAVLLAVLPDPRPLREADLPEEMRFPQEPVARFEVWQYEQILKKHLAPLVDAAGERTLTLFCDLLASAIRLSRRQPEEQPGEGELWDDYSWVWRPAVEEHEQNRRETVKTLLVSAVRDCAERLAGRAPESVPELVRRLEERRWLTFRRVALHLLRRYPDAATALVEERFTNRALFDDSRFRHEYVLLVADVFARVSEAARQTFLGWIDQGPDLAAFRRGYREAKGADPTQEEAVLYAKIWRRDRLAPVMDVLPAAWKRRYEELVGEVGQPEHPEFAVYTEAGWVGPTGPKSADELRTMAVEKIVDFLKKWTPPTDWFGPSREGLGRVLTSVVQADPQRFAREARLFTGVHPTYVRALVRGLTDAAKGGRAFDWAPVLGLCKWVVRHPREIQETPRRALEEDPGWGWTRKAIASLLSAGFAKGVAELSFDLRERAWGVLRVLTDDPEPTPDYEAQYGGSNMDPATLSINTTRGEAMHAVVQYALWVRRHLEQLQDGPARVACGLAAMPEVREVLEAHLDPARDPSLAIRAVYGQWFPWLVLLDRPWAGSQVARVFPEEDPERRDVAWETYVVFCAPYDNVFEVLEGEYAKAVERLGTGARGGRRHLADPEERLAEHLMLMYGRGKLALEPPTGLLGRFFEKAPGRVRGRAIEFIGRRLRDNKGDIPPAVIQRFGALWERRMERARSAPAESVEELANFGWWFVSQKFDEAWALRQLEEALRLAKNADPSMMMMVAETLASVAARRPREAVRCLEELVEADREGWGILGSEGQALTILATAMGGGDAEARETATALIHRLGRRGRLGFRDLLG